MGAAPNTGSKVPGHTSTRLLTEASLPGFLQRSSHDAAECEWAYQAVEDCAGEKDIRAGATLHERFQKNSLYLSQELQALCVSDGSWHFNATEAGVGRFSPEKC